MKQGQVGMTALETVAEDGGNKKASEGGSQLWRPQEEREGGRIMEADGVGFHD